MTDAPARGRYVRVYQDRAGEWRWTRYAANHEPTADSAEGYGRHAGALQAARDENPGVPVLNASDPAPNGA